MKFKVFSYKEVNSTNNTAIRLIKKNVNHGIVTSEIQKKGKGQIGKKWISKKGNLFISIFFPISKKLNLKNLINMNLNIIKNIISQIIPYKINIKLPNDIKILDKKVCGILQEIIFKNEVKFLIIGIGININSSPNFLKYKTTYLNEHLKKKIYKNNVFRMIKDSFEKKYELYV